MSLYSDYYLEREGLKSLECEHGFALYRIFQNNIVLTDIFVEKSARRAGIATFLVDEVCKIGRESECNQLIGMASLEANHFQDSLSAILSYGMKYSGFDEGKRLLLFKKDLS